MLAFQRLLPRTHSICSTHLVPHIPHFSPKAASHTFQAHCPSPGAFPQGAFQQVQEIQSGGSEFIPCWGPNASRIKTSTSSCSCVGRKTWTPKQCAFQCHTPLSPSKIAVCITKVATSIGVIQAMFSQASHSNPIQSTINPVQSMNPIQSLIIQIHSKPIQSDPIQSI